MKTKTVTASKWLEGIILKMAKIKKTVCKEDRKYIQEAIEHMFHVMCFFSNVEIVKDVAPTYNKLPPKMKKELGKIKFGDLHKELEK